MPQKLIAGNWKMNGLTADGLQLAGDTVRRVGGEGSLACDILICPPFTLLAVLRETLSGSAIALGGQDCHPAAAGAHTGDVSARMLADLGCSYVIVGHSERRHDHGESDSLVKAKAEAALAAGVTPIICVGETESERDSGQALAVIGQQVRASLPSGEAAGNLVLAYEPVWAIGTGRTASPEDVAEAHAEIRRLLREIRPDRAEEVRLLYGGSVKPGNAAELLATENVDGALVGGASLVCEDFLAIARSCP